MKKRGGKRDWGKPLGKTPRLCKRTLDKLEVHTDSNGNRIKECPECLELSTKVKKCLKCDKTFTPACRVRFLCVNCYDRNQLKHIEFYKVGY